MATNINIPVSHFTGDRTNTNFYYFSGGVMVARKRSSPYNVISTYPVDTYVGEVACAQFDGVYYWTLERSSSGFTVKKWELLSGILYQRNVFNYSTTPLFMCDATAFVVDSYNDSVRGGYTRGAYTLQVNSAEVFNIGDTIVVGTVSVHDDAVISGKSDDLNELYLSSPLSLDFSGGDGVYTTRYFYVFNRYGYGDKTRGSLIRYDFRDGTYVASSPDNTFADVTAACFYNDRVLFVKGHEVFQLNVSSTAITLFRRTTIDNLDVDRAGIVPIYAIWVYSDVLYRLQNKRVYYDTESSSWEEESWGDYYNYISEVFPTIFASTVYFVELKAYPIFIPAVSPPSIPTSTSNITVTVLNQDRTPLSGVSVALSTSEGTVVPSSGATDSNGQFFSTYNGTAAVTDVVITATAG